MPPVGLPAVSQSSPRLVALAEYVSLPINISSTYFRILQDLYPYMAVSMLLMPRPGQGDVDELRATSSVTLPDLVLVTMTF
jgi:hypothetical protein